MRDEELLAFRPMARDDLPRLRRWLAEPHVAEWWDTGAGTIEAVEANDGDRVGRTHPVQPWIVELGGRPVGFVQWYRVEDEAAWYPGVEIPAGTVALDLAIGDPDLVGKGLGRRVVLEFVHHVLRPLAPESTEVWIDPNPRNERAVRAYRAVGFADTGIDLPDPDDATQVRRLMRLRWAGPTFR
jgi:RimJ/RimL family protein N-acetyltransferase